MKGSIGKRKRSDPDVSQTEESEHSKPKAKGSPNINYNDRVSDVKNNRSDHSPVGVFKNLLSVSVQLSDGHSNNQIKVDGTTFQKEIGQALRKHSNFPQVVKDVLSGLQQYLEDSKRLHWSLMPTMTHADSDSSVRTSHHDSLIRLLLGVPLLQTGLMNALLEKLPEFAEGTDMQSDHCEKINVPRLILSQFRWLDSLTDGECLAHKLLELLGVTGQEVQREIITLMPDILDDAQHAAVASALNDLLQESPSLTVPILDALTSLSLRPDIIGQVREQVLNSLASASLDDLPTLIQFLMQVSTTPDEINQMVSEIRVGWDLSLPVQSNSSKKSKSRVRDESKPNTLVLDTIRSGLRFQKSIADAWIKVLGGVKKASDHYAIDIIMLFVLHTVNRKKAVETLLRAKVRSGVFTEAIIRDAFSHVQMLHDYFPSALCLADGLLRSSEPQLRHFATALYTQTFITFDTYCKQELVCSLVSHLGSGGMDEADAALDVLKQLTQSHLASLKPFTLLIKGVLDYIDALSLPQIRSVYSILSALAFHSPSGAALIQDDLHIVVRKQLSSSSQRYKQMGVLGALMMVQGVFKGIGSADGSLGVDEACSQVITMLQLVQSSVEMCPAADALYLEELASIMEHEVLYGDVMVWICENVINCFQDDYVVDIETEKLQRESVLPISLLYGLDDENEGTIAVDIIPLLVKEHEQRRKGAHTDKLPSAVCLVPHFRLLRICEDKQNSGDLSGIDALLGCPLYTGSEVIATKFSSHSSQEKQHFCTTLLLAINWFRELVNSFAGQSDLEMRGKVISRLQNITHLEKTLAACVAEFPEFQAPGFEQESMPTATVKKPKSRTGKGKKRKKQSGTDNDDVSDSQTDEPPGTSKDDAMSQKASQSQAASDPADTSTLIQHPAFRKLFRELEMDVFHILNTDHVNRASLDTDMNTKTVTEVRLDTVQLEFLLRELTAKLQRSLASTATKHSPFQKRLSAKCSMPQMDRLSVDEIMSHVIRLLPTLSGHLDATSCYFQTLSDQNDGVIDGPGSDSPDTLQMIECYKLLIQIQYQILTWEGFVRSENESLLCKVLTRISSDDRENQQPMASQISPTQSSLTMLLRKCFGHFERLTDTVPNLSTAAKLLEVLIWLSEKSHRSSLQHKISTHAQSFLQREWLTADGQKDAVTANKQALNNIIKFFLGYSNDALLACEEVATKAIPELIDAPGHGPSNSYPTLTQQTLPTFYKSLLHQLVIMSNGIEIVKTARNMEDQLANVIRWNLAVRVFHVLVSLVKVFDSRSNLGSLFKYSQQFLVVFMRQGMPLLEHVFRAHGTDVQSLLKNLQLSTRALHHICGHSKIVRDVALTSQVPPLKRSLEAFVYRVKAMLMANQCLDAFWLGNLKNRDLQGEEILSQSMMASNTQTSAGDEDDDDQGDDCDDEDEAEKVEENNDEQQQSESDTDDSEAEEPAKKKEKADKGNDSDDSYSMEF